MWFTAAKFEADGIKAGTIFIAKKDYDSVKLYRIKFSADRNGKTIAITDSKNYMSISVEDAREWLTKPTKDFDAMIEESIMLCEGAYC